MKDRPQRANNEAQGELQGVAQLVECGFWKAEVAGAGPATLTNSVEDDVVIVGLLIGMQVFVLIAACIVLQRRPSGV